jgi:hypothetical protein
MSQFLVVNDLNFEKIMICFDNLNDELEYTILFNVSDKKADCIFNKDLENYIEQLIDNGYEELPYGIFLYNNLQDDRVQIVKIDQKSDQTHLYIYNYKEHRAGTHKITYDSQYDIYQSRFDDYRNTMIYILEEYINPNHIFEIDE